MSRPPLLLFAVAAFGFDIRPKLLLVSAEELDFEDLLVLRSSSMVLCPLSWELEEELALRVLLLAVAAAAASLALLQLSALSAAEALLLTAASLMTIP